jgi:hypothetical protein
MTPEKLKAMLSETIAPIVQRLAKVEAGGTLQANEATISLVEPLAAMLESAADDMESDGVGAARRGGHADVLRRMAHSMRAEAAMGKVPSVWRDHDYPTYASATTDKIQAQVTIAVQAATRPLMDEIAANATKLEAAQTRIKDLTAKARLTAPPPDRKTLSPDLVSLLEGGGIEIGDGNKLQLKH